MEIEKRKIELDKRENEIIYSKSIKAGKRIYYLDVKKSKNEDLFIAITESKKKYNGLDQGGQVVFEKHKIFLYKEDFNKFLEGLEDVIDFIKKEQGEPEPRMIIESDQTESTTTEENAVSEDPETKKGFFDKFKF